MIPEVCRHGHRLTPETVYVRARGDWSCRECGRIAVRKYAARKKAEELTRKAARKAAAHGTPPRTIDSRPSQFRLDVSTPPPRDRRKARP